MDTNSDITDNVRDFDFSYTHGLFYFVQPIVDKYTQLVEIISKTKRLYTPTPSMIKRLKECLRPAAAGLLLPAIIHLNSDSIIAKIPRFLADSYISEFFEWISATCFTIETMTVAQIGYTVLAPYTQSELLYNQYYKKNNLDPHLHEDMVFDASEHYEVENKMVLDLPEETQNKMHDYDLITYTKKRVHRGKRRNVAIALTSHLTRFTVCGKAHFTQLRDIAWNWFADCSPNTLIAHRNIILAHSLQLLMNESYDFSMQREYIEFVGKLPN